MKITKTTRAGLLGLLVLALAGCNLPMAQQPTQFVFPTPNLTMTALFRPPVVIPPTVTSQPQATNTEASAPEVTATGAATQPPAAATATTAPAAPTATTAPAVPTRTPIPTDRRGGSSANALFVSSAPNIEGDWAEWDEKAYPAASVTFGRSNWSNDADLEASYKAAWDNNNLYLAVKVRDDQFVQGQTGANMYKGDSVEILIDTNVQGDFFSQELSSDDIQLGFSPGNPVGTNEEAYLWYPSSRAGKPSGISVAAVSGTGVWRIEVAIPWSVLGITPSSGMHLGFALSVSDNDKTGQNVQETMVSSAPNRSLVDPTTWGDLTLVK